MTRSTRPQIIETDFTVISRRDIASVEVHAKVAPLSLQSAVGRRRELTSALASALAAGSDFLFVHDVEVTLEWFATERDRYQSHVAADLDNVLKPLIDAATGPDGVMIGDNQVQSIKASWLTPGPRGEGFMLRFDALNPDDAVARDGTAFVEFGTDTCYLLPGEAREHWPLVVKGYRNLVSTKRRLRRIGVGDEAVEALSPTSRPWHSQRLRMQGSPVHHYTANLSP